MKIGVLVPSAEYKDYAGARIRYGRTAPQLAERGIGLALHDIGEFDPRRPGCDILIVSKCHDARSLAAAAIVAQSGRLVGVDLFDDYFSQRSDSRLARFRGWLSQILGHCHFALCSTPAMAAVVETYRSGIPKHVMNDPAADLSLDRLADVLKRKLAAAHDQRRIKVAWFGVGDSPYFPIGLQDLAAFGNRLVELNRTGMDVELTVLTNARALTAQGLASLHRLPVRTHIEAWTEEREEQLLAEALVAFLPVGGQAFSTAKSLNRAVTALSAGCQVLSVGYPLYESFGPLLYRNPSDLLADLDAGSLRLSPDRIAIYAETMENLASPVREAERLAGFLEGLAPPQPPGNSPLALIHGHSTNGAAHKMVQDVNGLSVASPYCTAPLGFDVVFRGGTGGLTMLVSEKASKRLKARLQEKLRPGEKLSGRKFLELPGKGASPQPIDWSGAPLPFQLATYRHSIDEIARRVVESFGECRLILSETSALPFAAGR